MAGALAGTEAVSEILDSLDPIQSLTFIHSLHLLLTQWCSCLYFERNLHEYSYQTAYRRNTNTRTHSCTVIFDTHMYSNILCFKGISQKSRLCNVAAPRSRPPSTNTRSTINMLQYYYNIINGPHVSNSSLKEGLPQGFAFICGLLVIPTIVLLPTSLLGLKL